MKHEFYTLLQMTMNMVNQPKLNSAWTNIKKRYGKLNWNRKNLTAVCVTSLFWYGGLQCYFVIPILANT